MAVRRCNLASLLVAAGAAFAGLGGRPVLAADGAGPNPLFDPRSVTARRAETPIRVDATATTTTARLGSELGDVLVEPGADVVLVKLGWRWAP